MRAPDGTETPLSDEQERGEETHDESDERTRRAGEEEAGREVPEAP